MMYSYDTLVVWSDWSLSDTNDHECDMTTPVGVLMITQYTWLIVLIHHLTQHCGNVVKVTF